MIVTIISEVTEIRHEISFNYSNKFSHVNIDIICLTLARYSGQVQWDFLGKMKCDIFIWAESPLKNP